MKWLIDNEEDSWLACIEDPGQPTNKHTIVKGSSGSGKSTSYLQDLILEVGLMFILLVDYFGETATDFSKMIYRRYANVLIDDLSFPHRVLPVCFLPTSDDPNPFESERWNALYRSNFMESLLRTQKMEELAQPVKEDTLEAGLLLYQSLPDDIRSQVPIHKLYNVYRPWTMWHNFLLDVCTDRDLAARLMRIRSLHESTRLSTYGSAERLLLKTFREPAIKRRDSHKGVNIPQLIREKYVVILKGGPGVSRQAFRAVSQYWTSSVVYCLEQGES